MAGLKYFLFLFFVGGFLRVGAQDTTSELLRKLDDAISQRDAIEMNKGMRIHQMTDSLKLIGKGGDSVKLFEMTLQLSREYESFVYDSAFLYARKAQIQAYGIKDPSMIARSKMKMGFILLSKGLFSQALDTLNTVNQHALSQPLQLSYYSYLVRVYQDLSSYSRDPFYSPRYKKEAQKYCRVILKSSDPQSYHYMHHKALIAMFDGDFKGALELFQKLRVRFSKEEHLLAITNSWLGFIHSIMNNPVQSKQSLIRAAICDIHSCTKETVALRELAKLLFQEGNINLAHKYILIAKKDADFYGTEQRKLEISYVMPIIGGERLRLVEHQRKTAFWYSLLISGLTILILGFALIIYHQLKKLKKARYNILQSNAQLVQINGRLREASKIKEEYIGYYFNYSTQYIQRIEEMKKSISRLVKTRQFDSIETFLRGYNSKKERTALFENFDRVFLKIFPDFVNGFNQLFNQQDQIILKDSQLLNTDLRIFALIRLGVRDNEKIANILNLSVNTIYTYKTKIKNRSQVSNDEFESRIMEIKSV